MKRFTSIEEFRMWANPNGLPSGRVSDEQCDIRAYRLQTVVNAIKSNLGIGFMKPGALDEYLSFPDKDDTDPVVNRFSRFAGKMVRFVFLPPRYTVPGFDGIGYFEIVSVSDYEKNYVKTIGFGKMIETPVFIQTSHADRVSYIIETVEDADEIFDAIVKEDLGMGRFGRALG